MQSPSRVCQHVRNCCLILGTSAILFADDKPANGDAAIVPAGAKLETLWEKGGFTEGAAATVKGVRP